MPFTETTRFKVMRTVMGAANPILAAFLRRGSGGPMGRQLALLRFRGRRSGRWFETPIGYVRQGDVVVLVTSPSYTWWRNIVGGAEVDLRLAGEWRTGQARILAANDQAYDETVALQVAARGPGLLRGFGVAVDDTGHVQAADRDAATKAAHIVRVELTGSAPGKR